MVGTQLRLRTSFLDCTSRSSGPSGQCGSGKLRLGERAVVTVTSRARPVRALPDLVPHGDESRERIAPWIARLGLSGAWVDLHVPGSEEAGVELKPDCALVLFAIQGRQVAGWAARKGAVCPEPRYPGRDALARLVAVRNEVWESPYMASP